MKRVYKIYARFLPPCIVGMIFCIIIFWLKGDPFSIEINALLQLLVLALFYPTVISLGYCLILVMKNIMKNQNKKALEEYRRLKDISQKQKVSNQ